MLADRYCCWVRDSCSLIAGILGSQFVFAGLMVPGSTGATTTGSGCTDENALPLSLEAVLASAGVAVITATVGFVAALVLHKVGNARRVEFFGTAVEFFEPAVAQDATGPSQIRRRNTPRKSFRDSEIN